MANLMIDASTPPATMPAGYSAVAGYIGGHTPHIWSPAEWGKFGKVRKLPIYVPAVAIGANASASNEAFDALQALYKLKVPKGSPVVWDMEMAVNAGQINLVQSIMNWAGYYLWVYGSASAVFNNPVANGYWVADYRGIGPFMHTHAGTRATQYADGQQFDSSTVKQWQFTFRLKIW
jgi:hypothetical protein